MNIDPTGNSWWSKFWSTIVSVVATAISIFVPPLAPLMYLVNTFASGISSYLNGTGIGGILGSIGGSLAGGAVFGAIGKDLALGVVGSMSEGLANSFLGGAIGGAIEFGMAGFGAGFGGALGGGASLSQAARAGLFGAAIGGTIGIGIQGSYMAGWQDKVHGYSKAEVAQARATASVKREVSLEVVRKPLPGPAKKFVGGGNAGDHWGIRINDNYNELSGTWDFDYIHNPKNDINVVLLGGRAPGIAQSAANKNWVASTPMGTDLKYITKVYNNIQSNLGSHYYELDSYTCQTWVNNRLNLRNDNFN